MNNRKKTLTKNKEKKRFETEKEKAKREGERVVKRDGKDMTDEKLIKLLKVL